MCVYAPHICWFWTGWKTGVSGKNPQSTGEINYQNLYFRKVFTSLLCFVTIKRYSPCSNMFFRNKFVYLIGNSIVLRMSTSFRFSWLGTREVWGVRWWCFMELVSAARFSLWIPSIQISWNVCSKKGKDNWQSTILLQTNLSKKRMISG